MKSRSKFLVPAAVLGGTVAAAFASDLGDFLKKVAEEASSHHQEPTHYSGSAGYYPYAPPPQQATDHQRQQHAYDVGFRVGQDDFYHHLSKHFTRHPDLYDKITHDAFSKGYENGFDLARSNAQAGMRSYTPPEAVKKHVSSDLYPSGYYPYAAAPKEASKDARLRHAYEVGYRVGQDDFHHGHSKHFTRHEKLYDKETHNSFARGYEDGYDKARQHAKN